MIKRRRSAAPGGDSPEATGATHRARSAPAASSQPSRERPPRRAEPGEDEEADEKEDEEDDDGSSDDSEDDAPRNRIGNVPLEWYKDEDHVGYDLAGEKVMREIKSGEIDSLLESADNPD